jgi:hypothetical protein
MWLLWRLWGVEGESRQNRDGTCWDVRCLFPSFVTYIYTLCLCICIKGSSICVRNSTSKLT